MKSISYVRASRSSKEPMQVPLVWFRDEDRESAGVSGRGDLNALTQAVAAGPIALIIDAALVRTLKAVIPGRSQQQVRQAAPYAIEEELAADPDDIDITLSPTLNASEYDITVCARGMLDDLLMPFRAAGLNIEQIISDAMLLPWQSETITILIEPERALIKYDERQASAIDRDALSMIVARLVSTHRPTTVNVFVAEGGEWPSAESDALNQSCAGIDVRTQRLTEDPLRWLIARGADRIASSKGFNLLPERHRIRSRHQRVGRQLAIAAAIFSVALVLNLFADWYQIRRAKSQLAEVKIAQEETFRQAFPQVKRVVNAQAQAQQLLKELQQTGPPPADFLEILYTSTALLQDGSAGIDLTGLTYADGVLLLRTESDDIDSLEKYRVKLSSNLVAEVVTAEANNNKIRGALRVRRHR